MTKLQHINIDISSTALKAKLNLDYIPNKIKKEVQKIWNNE